MGGRGSSFLNSKNKTQVISYNDQNAAAIKNESPKNPKSSSSDFFKKKAAGEKEAFFGETKKVSNKYFEFKRVKDDNNIVLVTNNVIINRNLNTILLVVGNNKAVYLKEWQVRQIRNYDLGVYGYAVKLNRNYYKTYTFKKEFDNYSIDKDQTFDDLLEVAKEQDKENMAVATGSSGGRDFW